MRAKIRRAFPSNAAFLSAILLINQFSGTTAISQAPSPSPNPAAVATNAPVPPQIAAAHAVFLTNSGFDPNFPVPSTRAYNDVYTALQSWGHFQMVSAPEQADLIFQLHAIAPITSVYGGPNGGVRSYTSPSFQLTILDRTTNIALWTISSPVYYSGFKSSRERWYTLSVGDLISRIKVVAGQPLSAEETANLTLAPKSHVGLYILIGVGALAIGATAAIIAVHSSSNNAKADQDAFCNAHNIPLSQCAGG